MKLLYGFLILLSVKAFAVPVAINRRDVKFPTQQMVEKQTFTNPAAAGTADVLSAHAGNTSAAAATASTFVAQPDVPRNLVITPGGTTGDVEGCFVTVTGTDFNGASLTEQFQFVPNQSTGSTGVKAFKTVSLVSFAAGCESGSFAATWSVGYGERLGLKSCVANAGDFFFSLLNGSKEATAPTLYVHATILASNNADFNGTMDGSADFVLYFMQNFNCFP